MKLHTLKPRPGSKHRRKRIGFGESSGKGKTAGKGHKGQRARSGSMSYPGFEGGQMPLYRRLPRRGFNNKNFHTTYAVFSVATLEARFEAGATVNEESLRACGLLTGNRHDAIKILADGEITKKLTIAVDKVSASAQEKLEKAGCTIDLIAPPVVEEKKKPAPKKAKVEAAPAAAAEAEPEAKAEEPEAKVEEESAAPVAEDEAAGEEE